MVVNMGSLFDPSMMTKKAKTNRPRLTSAGSVFCLISSFPYFNFLVHHTPVLVHVSY